MTPAIESSMSFSSVKCLSQRLTSGRKGIAKDEHSSSLLVNGRSFPLLPVQLAPLVLSVSWRVSLEVDCAHLAINCSFALSTASAG